MDFYVHREYPGQREPKTMLFWDYWKFHHMDNIEIVQGKPEWVPEAGISECPKGQSGFAGRVYYSEQNKRWQSIGQYTDFYHYHSKDGIKWHASNYPKIVPDGGKKAPNHVFKLPGEGHCPGWLYLDPIAADGYPYKIPVIQSGPRVYERALADKNHRWHDLAKKMGKDKHHFMDHIILISKDGFHWETRLDYDWGQGVFFPEEPQMMFFNHLTGLHTLVVRPGLGDRRVCIITTKDFIHWSRPRLVLQPDLLDGKILEFYTMPTFPYGSEFVGFPWASHFASSQGPDFQVLHKGPQNAYLAHSPDGEYFVRPTREAFIDFNEPGLIGCNSIRPEGMVTLEDEVRIYSNAGFSAHGTEVPDQYRKKAKGTIMHRLRRDGFMYIRTKGYWGEFTTRPFAVFGAEFTMNAEALTGEVQFELRDTMNESLEGYTFDDCIPLKFDDAQKHPLKWKNKKSLKEFIGGQVRLHIRFYNARIYSFRGDYHITDAHDMRLLKDGENMRADESLFGI